MSQEQRLMLAMLLCVLVFMVYTWYNTRNLPDPSEQQQGGVASATQTVTPGSSEPQTPADLFQPRPRDEEQPSADGDPIVSDSDSGVTGANWDWVETVPIPEFLPDIVVTNGNYRITFSRTGGVPIDWELTQYEELLADPRFLQMRAETGSPDVRQRAMVEFNYRNRIEEEGETEYVHAMNPLFDAGDAGLMVRWGNNLSDQEIVYTADRSEINVEQPETLVFRHEANGVVLEKSYTFFPDQYNIDFQVRILNQSDSLLTFGGDSFYDVLWKGGFGFPSFREDAMNEIKVRQDGDVTVKPMPTVTSDFQRGTSGDPGRSTLSGYPFPAQSLINEQVDWIGVGQKYFIAAIMPRSLTEVGIQALQMPDEENPSVVVPAVGVRMPLQSIPTGGSHSNDFVLYVGPLDEKQLALAAPELEDAKYIFWKAFMGPIAAIMTDLLQWLYGIVGNYGVAIILLTLIIKLLMFPLYHKQLVSMKKMQKLAPQINALKEKYKDDTQKQQKETMELFRKHKVNPLSGCLPILPTIPIFIALYGTFSTSVELRGAEFFAWIHDLSVPDGAFYIPIGAYIFTVNILPLAYAVLMLISTSLNKVEGPNATAMKIVPLVFVFFFWSIASGVILYFVISIAIDLTQRLILDRLTRDDEPVPAKAKG